MAQKVLGAGIFRMLFVNKYCGCACHRATCISSLLLLSSVAMTVLLWVSLLKFSFFSVDTITHEPLHVAWWNFAWTCTLTAARTLLNISVKGQGHRTGFSDFSPLRVRAKTVVNQGSDTWVRTQKKSGWFFGYTHLKNPPQKKPTLLL